MKAENCNGGHSAEQENWNIVWCTNAWHALFDRWVSFVCIIKLVTSADG